MNSLVLTGVAVAAWVAARSRDAASGGRCGSCCHLGPARRVHPTQTSQIAQPVWHSCRVWWAAKHEKRIATLEMGTHHVDDM